LNLTDFGDVDKVRKESFAPANDAVHDRMESFALAKDAVKKGKHRALPWQKGLPTWMNGWMIGWMDAWTNGQWYPKGRLKLIQYNHSFSLNMAANITNASEATAHHVENPVPNAANMALIFQCCPAVNAVFGICGLNERQKLALIRQGINSIAKLRLLGKDRSAIQALIKPISTLSLICGRTEFRINIITALAALVRFYDDCCCLSLGMGARNSIIIRFDTVDMNGLRITNGSHSQLGTTD
jgi:hypothetical protein